MKRLIVNNIEVVLNKDVKIPYSVRNFNLNNPTLINIDKSKSIELQRCNINDEAFGFISNKTRLNTSSASGQGVLFNPIKKNTYQLLEDSELISEGLVNILEANDKVIIIELYDALLEKFNDLDDKYINDVDLFTEQKINVDFIINPPAGLTPVFGLDDAALDKSHITCRIMEGNNVRAGYRAELPRECFPIDLRTFKTYEVRYGVDINTIIDKINQKWGNIIDNRYNFESLHLLTNKPTSKPHYGDFSVSGSVGSLSGSTPFGSAVGGNLIINNKPITQLSGHITPQSQKINVNSNLIFTLRSGVAQTTVRQLQLENEAKTESYFADRQYVGQLKSNIKIICYKRGQVVYISNQTETIIDLLWKVNYFKINNDLKYIGTILSTFDLPPIDFDTYRIETTITNLIYPQPLYNSYDSGFMWFFRKQNLFTMGATYNFQTVHNIIETNSDKLLSYSKVNTKTLLPKVKVKDFLVAIIKSFNLHTEVNGGKIVIREKNFKYSADLPIINLNNIKQTRIVDKKTIIMSSEIADDVRLDNYKTKYDKSYAEQVIDLGYTINSKKEEIKLPYSIPFYQSGINAFAYDAYNDYRNGGYSKTALGSFVGLNDKLTFGYLAEVNEKLYINDDLLDEFLSEDGVGMANDSLVYNPTAPDYDKFKVYNNPNNRHKVLDTFRTFSPYTWRNDVIYKSLEVNKPLENYGYVKDSSYPEDSTHYSNYFKNMYSQLYDQDSYIIEVDMLIKSKLDFETIFNWDNADYVIYEVDEYEPQRVGVYRVKLLRVMDKSKLINLYNRPDTVEILSMKPIENRPANQDLDVIFNLKHTVVSGKVPLYSGVCYSRSNPLPTIANNKTQYNGLVNVATTSTPFYGDYMHYRAYIRFNDGTTIYSSVMGVQLPQAIVKPSCVVTATPVKVGGSVFNGIKFSFSELFDGRSPIVIHSIRLKYGTGADWNNYNEIIEKDHFVNEMFVGALDQNQLYSYFMVLGNEYVDYELYGEVFLPAYVNPQFKFIIRAYETTNSITVNYGVDKGTDNITDCLLLWGLPTNPDPTISSYLDGEPVPTVSNGYHTIKGLNPSAGYKIRLAARAANGTWYYSPTSELWTLSNPPQLSVNAVGQQLSDRVTAYCSYTVDNPSLITERGVCWARNHIPTIDDIKQFDVIRANGTTTFFNCSINPLFIGEYWFRSYLILGGGSVAYSTAKRISVLRPNERQISQEF